METTVLLVILGFFVLLLISQRMRAHVVEERSSTPPDAFTPYHGVEIKACGPACDAVKRLSGKRFLADEAPLIPLSDCTLKSAGCDRCVYVHFDDRRAHRRRSVIKDRSFQGQDRRGASVARIGRRFIDQMQLS
jgi:hypothetical protein